MPHSTSTLLGEIIMVEDELLSPAAAEPLCVQASNVSGQIGVAVLETMVCVVVLERLE